ncbi:plasminogen-like [Ciona intestinalis]
MFYSRLFVLAGLLVSVSSNGPLFRTTDFGKWTSWSDWGECSVTCDKGVQYKSRNCTDGIAGIGKCNGLAWEARACVKKSCDSNSTIPVTQTVPSTPVPTTKRAKSYVRDCYDENRAASYRGFTFRTISGRFCQQWTSNFPHVHSYTPSNYPEGGLGPHSYCRSPDNDHKPWCFTSDPAKKWEYCNIKKCSELPLPTTTTTTTTKEPVTYTPTLCFDMRHPYSYRGTISTTSSGLPCQMWDYNKPHSHIYTSSRFPTMGLGFHNQCRNPDGDLRPWCFTTHPGVPWEYCNVPSCNDPSTTTPPVWTTTFPTTTEMTTTTPRQLPDGCGRPLYPMASSFRIFGGVESVKGSLPWQLSLRKTSGNSHYCGATIISAHWVITAAHCITSPDLPHTYYAMAGKYYRNVKNEPGEVRINFLMIFKHRLFNAQILNNDIALMKVTAPITFTNKIQAACLPTTKQPPPDQRIVIVSGWGRTQTASSSSVLMQASLKIISSARCRPMHDSLDEGMMCAGYISGGRDSCQGDSGGPLIDMNDNNGRYEIVGIVSWGIGCGLPNKPGVYTQVSYYLDWINWIMSSY